MEASMICETSNKGNSTINLITESKLVELWYRTGGLEDF
jgi:hypothetical protein